MSPDPKVCNEGRVPLKGDPEDHIVEYSELSCTFLLLSRAFFVMIKTWRCLVRSSGKPIGRDK